MTLEKYLPGIASEVSASGKIAFHAFGDSGGVYGTEAQDAVAAALEAQATAGAASARPKFLFHLGDVIYFNGEDKLYNTQFYEPYQYYNAPIFAVPGNHDGDNQVRPGDPADPDPYSLYGFMQNFCNTTGKNKFKYRPPMDQPYCYWTLKMPFVQIVGLYSNVDGCLDRTGKSVQRDWLQQQLETVPADKWLIVAVHHPCYSLDTVHGGYQAILDSLDSAFKGAKRVPDMVLSGHVHNYQRFSRQQQTGATPYIICGNAGYAKNKQLLHALQTGVASARLPFQTLDQPDVKLQAFDDGNAGFLRVTATANELTSDYFAVPFAGTADTANPVDTVSVAAREPKTV